VIGDKEIKVEFFYAFLRNRLLAEASDFPLFMAKRFWARIPFGNKTVRFYHLYSEILRVPASNPTLSATFLGTQKPIETIVFRTIPLV